MKDREWDFQVSVITCIVNLLVTLWLAISLLAPSPANGYQEIENEVHWGLSCNVQSREAQFFGFKGPS